MFVRRGGRWAYRSTGDWGASWGPEKTLINATASGMGQFYVVIRPDPARPDIYRLATYGHPVTSSYRRVATATINSETSDVLLVDGTVVGNLNASAGPDLEPDELDIAISPSSGFRVRLLDVGTVDDAPAVNYAVWYGDVGDATYKRKRYAGNGVWTSDSWSLPAGREFGFNPATHYLGGAMFTPGGGLVTARQEPVGSTTGTWVVERWEPTANHGLQLTDEIRRSSRQAARPYPVTTGDGALHTLVQDMYKYDHFTEYDVDIIVYTLDAASCVDHQAPFAWSCAGPIDGMVCTQVRESADPHTWDDNYFCAESDLGMRWSSAGPIAGMLCTQIREPADPHTWDDNYLCLPVDTPYELTWHYAGPGDGSCVRWSEPADPHTWNDNYLCWSQRFKEDILSSMRQAHAYHQQTNEDPGDPGWQTAAYFAGLMETHLEYPEPTFIDYATLWGESNAWNLVGGPTATHADSHCAGQTYVDLYELDPDPVRISAIDSAIASMVEDPVHDDWWWIDALFMAMPTFARLGNLHEDPSYFEKMFQLYDWTKHHEGGGLYSTTHHLWWRDEKFVSMTTPAGKPVFWSRGNGWVYAALARTLSILPDDHPDRGEYEQVFVDMSEALLPLQRGDGFWNPSLMDAQHHGGPETSGTAFFVYGMAWGIDAGLLDPGTYMEAALRGWRGLTGKALFATGKLGYVQPPSDRPAAVDPEGTADYGVGGFLLAGTALLRLTPGTLGATVTERNLAIDKPVSASAQQTGNEAERAVDNRTSTRWSAQGFPQSIEVDLGEVQTVGEIELVPWHQRPYQFRIEARSNSTDPWTTVVDATANNREAPFHHHVFAARDARYVRATVTGIADDSTTWVSILELRVLQPR